MAFSGHSETSLRLVIQYTSKTLLLSGPRPTISSAEARVSRKKEAAAPETQFVCPPTLHQDPRRGRNWRAFPDPASSK